MSDLIREGAVVISGPLLPSEVDEIRLAYDAVQASAPKSRIKRGSTSTRFSGFVAQAPFCRIYLHSPLLRLAFERIGGPFKLSSFVGRTLHPHTPAPPLHQDVRRGADGDPLVGFIYMVDAFTTENGATRYLPGSQDLLHPPLDSVEHCACGPPGSMLIFDGLTWHEHGANRTDVPRRSIQGYFVRRDHTAAMDWSKELTSEQRDRLPVEARNVLCL
jgi:hypothetical protein